MPLLYHSLIKIVFPSRRMLRVSKGLLVALYHFHGNRYGIANTLKKLYANSFIQMSKHCFSHRDNSVVIFLHSKRIVIGRKPFRASLNKFLLSFFIFYVELTMHRYRRGHAYELSHTLVAKSRAYSSRCCGRPHFIH